MTTEELATFLGIDAVRISRERYQSSPNAKTRVTGDFVLLFFGLDGTIIDDPTHAKRFWSATEGGGKFRVYENQPSPKYIDLAVEHYSNVLVTSTLGIRKITV